jgi:hypothetical protein
MSHTALVSPSLSDTLMQGGLLDAIPPHATFIILGLPSDPYVPMMSTGVGSKTVLGSRESFIIGWLLFVTMISAYIFT